MLVQFISPYVPDNWHLREVMNSRPFFPTCELPSRTSLGMGPVFVTSQFMTGPLAFSTEGVSRDELYMPDCVLMHV